MLTPCRNNLLVALLICAVPSCKGPDARDSRHPFQCNLFPEAEPAVCEQTRDGRIFLARESLPHVVFGDQGLGTIVVGKGSLYFVNRNGKTAQAFRFDNGADYVVEGLARSVKNGKIGFVNTKLEQVVPPVWDFASPFEHGVARVCLGCTTASDGEHATTTGGKWGYIDKRGKVIIPVEFEGRSLPSVEAAARLAGN